MSRVSRFALVASILLSLAADKPPDVPPALAKLHEKFAGSWGNAVGPKGREFVVEFRYDWAFRKSAVRGVGVLGKGSEYETDDEVTYVWDVRAKRLAFVYLSGGNLVYTGHADWKGDELHAEFEPLVGDPSKFRSVTSWSDSGYAFGTPTK